MSHAYRKISQGLKEAIAYSKGNTKGSRVYEPFSVDVQNVRHQTGMTQEEFSAAFGISLGTLRHWERGDRSPRGPALVLLNLVAKKPKSVLKLLSEPAVA